MYVEVLPKLAQSLDDTGEMRYSLEGAKIWLKQLCHFGTFYKLKGTEEAVFVPDSFADAGKENMVRIIDTAIEQAALRGTVINPPKVETFIFKGNSNA